jgi:nucleotide-binding universal stress UspA family protein
MTGKLVVGVDGSLHSERAVKWCAEHARLIGAEVVAVHAVDIPVYGGATAYFPALYLTPEQRDELRDVASRDWCKPLADAGITFDVELVDDTPSAAVLKVAEEEDAVLVVVGRRGRGGFAELVLGSVGHQLAHHLACPLVIVP